MALTAVDALVAAERASLDRWREGDAWLAGGTWLFSEPQRDLRRLIDLSAFGWESLRVSEAGLELAATCTLAELAAWPGDPRWPAARLARDCCRARLGSFKICNAATGGGNLCLALPAGPMISLAVALEGVCEIWAPDGRTRELAAGAFVLGPSVNALDRGELLRAVRLPAQALGARSAFRQRSLSPLGRSAVIVIGRASPGDGSFALTVTASVPRPLQLPFTELPAPDDLQDAIVDAVDDWYDDVHGDPAWREHLTLSLAEEVRAELAAQVGSDW